MLAILLLSVDFKFFSIFEARGCSKSHVLQFWTATTVKKSNMDMVLFTLAHSVLSVNAYWLTDIGSPFLLQGLLFPLTQSQFY